MVLYNLIVFLYGAFIRIASLQNKKAKFWVRGRAQWQSVLKEKTGRLGPGKRVWIHCASLGEFEQGRPIIEAIKASDRNIKIILTFFSPSGYEVRKDYEHADIISYLPLDTPSNAKEFIEIISPDKVIFVKYEFWVNYLNTLRNKGIESYLISAVFKDHHPFFKWYGGIFIKSLKAFRKLMVQDQHSADLVSSIGFNNVEVLGDTRADRVLEIRRTFVPYANITSFVGSSPVVVAGSTWPQDEEVVLNTYDQLSKTNQPKLIIAPHEINEKTIGRLAENIEKRGHGFCRYSVGVDPSAQIMILDTMGMLSKVYGHATLAYVGGGFGDGIHNLLEPAVFGLPVAFGAKANYSKYNEAVQLKAIGAAFDVSNAQELKGFFDKFIHSQSELERVKDILRAYFEVHGNISARMLKTMNFV